MYDIEHYVTPEGRDLYQDWIDGLRDRKAKIALIRRVDRMTMGNFGDHKFCRDGVWELRIDIGPGYRIYYALHGSTLILLLCGGDKKTQTLDIKRACSIWKWEKGTNDADKKPR